MKVVRHHLGHFEMSAISGCITLDALRKLTLPWLSKVLKYCVFIGACQAAS
jgi:hypothetical protein